MVNSRSHKKKITKYIVILILIITLVILLFNIMFCRIGNKYKFRYAHDLKIFGYEVNDANQLNNFTHLRTLGLFRWEENEFEFIKSMRNLEDLTITAYGKDLDLNWISDCKKLKVFYSEAIDFNNLNYFSKMDNLQLLHICMGEIQSIDGLQFLSGSLNRLELSGIKNTESLDLNNFKYLTQAEITISSVKTLSVDSVSVKKLNVSFNPNLKQLIISDSCNNIEVLETDNCKELKLDFQTVKKLHSLKQLIISEGQISESEIQELKTNGVEVVMNDWY